MNSASPCRIGAASGEGARHEPIGVQQPVRGKVAHEPMHLFVDLVPQEFVERGLRAAQPIKA